MRAAFLPAPGQVAVGDFDVPVPGAAQVLVRMRHAAICGSDLHVVYHGFHTESLLGQPGYPGHEGVGVIVESHSDRFAVGDAVLTVPPGSAGGCFAEYQVVADTHVVRLPAGDPRKLLLAQQLGTTIFAMKRFWPGAAVHGTDQTAVVLGAGSAGLFFVQLLKQLGFEHIIISDPVPERLTAASELGATQALPPGEQVSPAVLDLTGGKGAALVIEAAGLDSLRATALELVRDQGTVGCYGFPQTPGSAQYPAYTAFRKSAAMVWTNATQSEPALSSFRQALHQIAVGAVNVDHCLGRAYDLEHTRDAFEAARDPHGAGVKMIIDLPAA